MGFDRYSAQQSSIALRWQRVDSVVGRQSGAKRFRRSKSRISKVSNEGMATASVTALRVSSDRRAIVEGSGDVEAEDVMIMNDLFGIVSKG